MKKQSFLGGAAVLGVSTVIVKIIGMLYKVPLGNILGGTGMSYFMTAYNIFNPIYALSVAGFPVAVSRMIAESIAKRRYRDTKQIFCASFILFILTGIAGSAAMLFCAASAVRLIGNEGAYLSVIAIAPSIFFCCILSAYRGYYQGLGSMTPTAVSQVVESVFRFICGVALSLYASGAAMKSFGLTGTVFGQPADTYAAAYALAMPWAAAGAILGVTLSSALSAVYLVARHILFGDSITADMLNASPKPHSTPHIVKRLAVFALPVCAGSVLTNITALIDVATIMNGVESAMARDSEAILSMYGGLIPREITVQELPHYLFGAFSYTSSLFNLIPALTIPLGVSALPVITSYCALNNKLKAGEMAQSVIKLSSLVAIPSGLGLCALSGPILGLLYPLRPLESTIAAPILASLGIAAVFLGITAPLSSIFQAAGRADIPVKLMAAGALLKTSMNIVLVAVPQLNINAAPYGTILCYFFIFTASLILIQSVFHTKIDMSSTVFKPLFCGIICAASANISYRLMIGFIPAKAACLFSIAISGIIFLIFAFFLKIIDKNEILLLQNGKNIIKILEKLKLLG